MKQTAVFDWGPLTSDYPIIIEQEKKMNKEKEKQMLIGLLDWMNKVAQDNPMVFETDSEDIVEMYLEANYTKNK